MGTAALLLVCCALAGALGQRVPCTVDRAGTRGECCLITQCPALYRLARTARPNSPAVARLRRLVVKCPRTASGRLQVCCQSEETSAAPALIQLPTEECGTSPGGSRVIGGENATIGEFPWMASVQYAETPGAQPRHGCGGTLITSRHVLTAAHCVSYLATVQLPDLAPVAVVLGELDFNSDVDCSIDPPRLCADRPVTVNIEAIFAHPGFEIIAELALPHDIAVVKLARHVTFTDFIRPVCLLQDFSVLKAGHTDQTTGVNGVVAGWGRSQVTAGPEVRFTPVLQKARLPVRPLGDCERTFGGPLPGRLCAGGGPNSTDTCRGDSGGPLMLYSRFGARAYQTGVSSFGASRCGNVAGYTRVLDYLDWIVEQINK